MNPTNKERAAVVLRAMRILDAPDGSPLLGGLSVGGFSCLALKVAYATELSSGQYATPAALALVDSYSELFKPSGDRGYTAAWLQNDIELTLDKRAQDRWRLVALAFYAAMIEAGDA